MRTPRRLLTCIAIALLLPVQARAQSNRVLDIVEAVFDRFLVSAAKEQAESGNVRTQLEDAEAKIAKYEKCARDFEAGGGSSPVGWGRLRPGRPSRPSAAPMPSRCGRSARRSWMDRRMPPRKPEASSSLSIGASGIASAAISPVIARGSRRRRSTS